MFTNDENKKVSLFGFAYLGEINDFLNNLSTLALIENWNYSIETPGRPFPILLNYICHTFMRIYEQQKIINVGDFYCFNTGLVTENQQEIFAVFKKYENEKIYFKKFCTESDSSMSYYFPLPERASYFNNPSELIFDIRKELRINIDHIIGDPINFDRLPEEIKQLPNHQLVNTFNGAIEHAKKRVKRNYKTAIPQFYRNSTTNEGQLQLLLPLCLINHSKADLALAVYKDKEFYNARTCLTLDMAINNARLIAKPDDEWLRP